MKRATFPVWVGLIQPATASGANAAPEEERILAPGDIRIRAAASALPEVSSPHAVLRGSDQPASAESLLSGS